MDVDALETTPPTAAGLTAALARLSDGNLAPALDEAVRRGRLRAACILLVAQQRRREPLRHEVVAALVPRLADTRWIPWLMGRGVAVTPASVDSLEARALVLLCRVLLGTSDGADRDALLELRSREPDFYAALLIANALGETVEDPLAEGVRTGVKRLLEGDLGVIFPADRPRTELRVPGTGRTENRAPGTGRNDPCPCGSGRKYKKCCGA